MNDVSIWAKEVEGRDGGQGARVWEGEVAGSGLGRNIHAMTWGGGRDCGARSKGVK